MRITVVVAPNGDCVIVSVKLTGYDVSYENGRSLAAKMWGKTAVSPTHTYRQTRMDTDFYLHPSAFIRDFIVQPALILPLRLPAVNPPTTNHINRRQHRRIIDHYKKERNRKQLRVRKPLLTKQPANRP